ncbi:hypothetical protein OH809_45440 (plasmid) [Streptomyces sp. NBC_00873]|uniref:hypothetical protein n=1 Tax=unclassified Streptomyces TaxID=2593676 RepID=UPI002F9135BE|nr:hypothetical protein OH809_45440 [Streptomyces sp. NBC_00873]WTA49380.1 hypothetical protein OH821_45485 [Streptomyces sp. NBC_00842]
MTEQTAPQPADELRHHLAKAMAKEAGSKAFMEPGTAWDHARSEWLAHADAAVNALHRWERKAPAGGHVYLSTGCLHGEHAYCQSMTGQQGEKRPGRCKFCDARCTCSCHAEGAAL